LGIGDRGLGPIPNPQSPIPNPQSPIPILRNYFIIKRIKAKDIIFFILINNLNIIIPNNYTLAKSLLKLFIFKGETKDEISI